MSDRRNDEKERLWNEVMNKKRAYEKPENEIETDLTLDANVGSSTMKKSGNEILKSAENAMNELNRILKKQANDLMNLSKQTQDINPIGIDEEELEQMRKDLEKDYGEKIDVSMPEEVETKSETVEEFDSKKVFDEVFTEVTGEIIGENEAVRQLLTAFRRPFVMGKENGKASNIVLVSGPEGTGRHESLTAIAKALKTKKVFADSEVYTIDMSRYSSGSQESIFLQDLYQAIKGSGSVICFENFEVGFPSFLRMINSLVTTGRVVLSKRYVLTKGILVENQTGLVADSVDSLSAEGKYLVFVTNEKPSKVQDSFGADFMYHVMDTVTFKALDEEAAKEIIHLKGEELVSKAEKNLKVDITIKEEVEKWILTHYDKGTGADSINNICNDFYVSLSHLVLQENLGAHEAVSFEVKEDAPYAVVGSGEIRLSRSKSSSEEIAAVNAELDEIVGLDMVKDYIRSLQSHIAMNQKRKEQGMKTAALSKHMIFTGNPGTGKTTIARLISRYMKAIGALSEGQLVEVTRADLVAQYVGQTAPLTMSVIKSAIGGVLFVDEAYSLYRGKDDSFGLECIDTLVKAMEDNRDNLIVILAGYKKEMAVFLESNSGLKSRFPNLINFDDYTGEELEKISMIQAKSKGYTVAEDVKEPLIAYFNEVQSINPAEAGNGRLSRNVIEEAILKQSERLVAHPEEDMNLLKLEDFDLTVKVTAPKDKDDTTLEDLAKLLKK